MSGGAVRLLLVGYGRMGRLVDSLSDSHHCTVVGRLDVDNNAKGEGLLDDTGTAADVAIDFSTADAVLLNFPRLAERGLNIVVGTTGWGAHEADMRAVAERAGIGVVAASNFSVGVLVFEQIVREAARHFSGHDEFGAWLYEIHHAAKRDAPSGTALMLQRSMEAAGYARRIDVASSRAGAVPGTHTVGFDAPFETITLTHTARDRATFAHGALVAARWIHGRRGWYGMKDVLGFGS